MSEQKDRLLQTNFESWRDDELRRMRQRINKVLKKRMPHLPFSTCEELEVENGELKQQLADARNGTAEGDQ